MTRLATLLCLTLLAASVGCRPHSSDDTGERRMLTSDEFEDQIYILGDPNSALRDEDSLISFLRHALDGRLLTVADSMRAEVELARCLKNRPGSIASDFAITMANGDCTTLHRFVKGNPQALTLLAFYDPECPPCGEIMEIVASDTTINALISSGAIQVLAVYTEGNEPLWRQTLPQMAGQWSVAIDADSIVEREIYDIPAMPTLYLLSPDARVVLKDPPLPQLVAKCREWRV